MLKRAAIIIGAFIASVVLAVILASVAATQLTLASVQDMGLDVPFGVRVSTTFSDLIGIFPLLAIIVSVCFFLSFLVAALLVKFTAVNRQFLYGLAGGTSFIAFVYILWFGLGGIPLEAAATVGGRVLLAICCALGGLLFARLTQQSSLTGEPS